MLFAVKEKRMSDTDKDNEIAAKALDELFSKIKDTKGSSFIANQGGCSRQAINQANKLKGGTVLATLRAAVSIGMVPEVFMILGSNVDIKEGTLLFYTLLFTDFTEGEYAIIKKLQEASPVPLSIETIRNVLADIRTG